uniref:Uncharacterized protein n=2 Tax=Oreochromis TaxID=8139 RepID=A0A669CSD8_ORENI
MLHVVQSTSSTQVEQETYLDSSTPAFTHSIGHSSTRRVNHGHEANKAQVFSGEVHIISIKSKAFWELVIRQVIVAET